jgi:hypothetical protein
MEKPSGDKLNLVKALQPRKGWLILEEGNGPRQNQLIWVPGDVCSRNNRREPDPSYPQVSLKFQ